MPRSGSLTGLLAGAVLSVANAQGAPGLAVLEQDYADFNDAQGAVSLIDSDPQRYGRTGYAGRSRAQWQALYANRRERLVAGLPAVAVAGLSPADARALRVMREAVADSALTPESLAPVGHCADAPRKDLPLTALQQALYACFAEHANSLEFEGGRITRVAAFEMLTYMPEALRREALFRSFLPLWQALDGDGSSDSPYRRMIGMAGAAARKKGSPVDAAARTLGIAPGEVERWLVQILDTWRQVGGSEQVEPWDYRFVGGAAERELAGAVPRAELQALNERYYRDLGLDLAAAGVIYDLAPREGKAPLAYTDYVRRGRLEQGAWVPTLVRVLASYGRGGLGPLNELVHENGHAAHMLALHTRPAFMDLGDALFYEAFADVPAWNVYEPAWQLHYLGRSANEAQSLRALFSGVMLDVAWALFDLRMLKDPRSDPNQVWTSITQRYLHVKPHPELAWWAVRVQLVDKPGYMINYGLGAVITADIRARIAAQEGDFAAGDPHWYGWISDHLLSSGEEQETRELLRQFLGRPVSPQALLAALRRLAGAPPLPARGSEGTAR
jgi:hypothetical protein